MKKLLSYALLLAIVTACGGTGSTHYTVNGNGVGEGTAFIFGHNKDYEDLGSVSCNNSIDISLQLEKPTLLTLVLPDGNSIALFGVPGTTATLYPDSTLSCNWRVEGSRAQALHDSITRIIDATPDNIDRRNIIREFAKRHPVSEVNVELFRKYLVDVPNPDNEAINKAMSLLGGTLQDHEYFSNLKRRLEKKKGNLKHRMFPTFKYTTIKGENITQASYSGKYLLVTFWGTWNGEGRRYMQKLREVQNSIPSEHFAILNIALQSDTARWNRVVVSDSIVGDNVCDTNGISSEVTATINIGKLPYSILVTPYKRISACGLQPDSSGIALIDSLTTAHAKKTRK